MKLKTAYQNLYNAAKAVLRAKFITINAYIRIEQGSQANNLILYLRELEKEVSPKLAEGRK